MISHRRHRTRHLSLSYGVRIFAWVRAIRWFGWGLGEALLPIFILLFSKTYAEVGLLSSTVDIASLVSLPIIGVWADRMSARSLVLWSIFLYPFVGISYFLAGLFGMAIFIVIARVINGFNWELENVGIETYYRRVTDSRKIATSFGYLETWSHVAWISAALVGMWLSGFVPINYLLLGIAPFSVIAYFVALKAPKDVNTQNIRTDEKRIEKISLMRSYGRAIKEWRTWNRHLWLLGALVLFSGIVSSLMYLFIPVDAYLSGANLPMVVLITVFGAIPALFGYKLGSIADGESKYSLIIIGLLGLAVIAVGLVVFPHYWFKLLAMFLMGIILELFYVVQSSLITTLGSSDTYGERGSAFESITTLGDLVAPLVIGVGLDLIGFSDVALVIAVAAIMLAAGYRLMKIEI